MNIHLPLLPECVCECHQLYCQRLMEISGCFMLHMRGKVQACNKNKRGKWKRENKWSQHDCSTFVCRSSKLKTAEISKKKLYCQGSPVPQFACYEALHQSSPAIASLRSAVKSRFVQMETS